MYLQLNDVINTDSRNSWVVEFLSFTTTLEPKRRFTIHTSTFLTPAPVILLQTLPTVVLRLQNPGAYFRQCLQQAWRHTLVTARSALFLSRNEFHFTFHLHFQSCFFFRIWVRNKMPCPCLSWHFFTNNLSFLVYKFYLLKLCSFQFFQYSQHQRRGKIYLSLLSNFTRKNGCLTQGCMYYVCTLMCVRVCIYIYMHNYTFTLFVHTRCRNSQSLTDVIYSTTVLTHTYEYLNQRVMAIVC